MLISVLQLQFMFILDPYSLGFFGCVYFFCFVNYLIYNLGVVAYFAKEFGFTADETVALMGVHTLGDMHSTASGFSV